MAEEVQSLNKKAKKTESKEEEEMVFLVYAITTDRHVDCENNEELAITDTEEAAERACKEYANGYCHFEDATSVVKDFWENGPPYDSVDLDNMDDDEDVYVHYTERKRSDFPDMKVTTVADYLSESEEEEEEEEDGA
jgi:hypothetical protein